MRVLKTLILAAFLGLAASPAHAWWGWQRLGKQLESLASLDPHVLGRRVF